MTPGPWQADSEGSQGWAVSTNPPKGKWAHICVLRPNNEGSRSVTMEECEANARLIAAAPDLLAACEATITAFATADNSEMFANIMADRVMPLHARAVRKAHGESQ